MKRQLFTFALTFVSFLSTQVSAQCTIANQPANPNVTNNSGTYDYVQSFTAPCNGNMQYFELTSSEAGTLPGATLYVYDGNVANGTAIYTQPYSDITVAGPNSPITFNISGTLPLVMGNQYSFRFQAATLDFYFTTGDTYAGGMAWQNGSSLATTDFYFEVLIASSCTPTVINPDLANLPDLTSECSVAMPIAPTATNDCGTIVSGVPNVSFPITAQGTTVITWSYDDNEGNTTSQMQNVVIEDVSAPIPDITTLPDLTDQCESTSLVAPTATDNCGGTISGTHNAVLPITSPGTTVITWTYNDGNGNTTTQNQTIVNPTIDITTSVSGSTIQANQLVAGYQWLDCNNSQSSIPGAFNQSYTPATGGNYAVEITVQGCIDTSLCQLIDIVGIDEISNLNKELVKIVDLLGRETEFRPNTPLIYIYADGSMKRVMKLEE